MDFKFLLRLEKKKFILPIALVLMLAYLVSSSTSLVAVFDKYTCKIADVSKAAITAEKANNTVERDELNKTVESIAQKMADELRTVNSLGIGETAIALVGLDPFVPLPCEVSQSVFCSTYLTKKSYDCLYELANFTKENIENKTIAENIRIRPYSEPTVPIVYNSVILFAEGYLISCFLLGFYRKSKTKKSSGYQEHGGKRTDRNNKRAL